MTKVYKYALMFFVKTLEIAIVKTSAITKGKRAINEHVTTRWDDGKEYLTRILGLAGKLTMLMHLQPFEFLSTNSIHFYKYFI